MITPFIKEIDEREENLVIIIPKEICTLKSIKKGDFVNISDINKIESNSENYNNKNTNINKNGFIKDKNYEVKRLLQTIGMNTFITYFEKFKNRDPNIIKDFKEDWEENSKHTKAYIGLKIFDKNLEKEALEKVIASKRAEDKIIQKAKELYNKYYSKS